MRGCHGNTCGLVVFSKHRHIVGRIPFPRLAGDEGDVARRRLLQAKLRSAREPLDRATSKKNSRRVPMATGSAADSVSADNSIKMRFGSRCMRRFSRSGYGIDEVSLVT